MLVWKLLNKVVKVRPKFKCALVFGRIVLFKGNVALRSSVIAESCVNFADWLFFFFFLLFKAVLKQAASGEDKGVQMSAGEC